MNILATSYTLKHNSFDIYIAGCSGSPKCLGCHNPESWDFNIGRNFDEVYFLEIKNKIDEFDIMIDNIMIFGGEPLDQDHDELINLLKSLSKLNKKIWLFTRYDLQDVPSNISVYLDYIKTGRYIEELKIDSNIQHGINLATSNQKIFKKD